MTLSTFGCYFTYEAKYQITILVRPSNICRITRANKSNFLGSILMYTCTVVMVVLQIA